MKILLAAATISMMAVPAMAADIDLKDTTWMIRSLSAETIEPSSEGRPAQLAFDGTNALSASAGCNAMGGSYDLAGDNIEFGPLFSTKMMCSAPVMEREVSLSDALEQARMVSIEEDMLTLKASDGAVLLTAQRVAP